MKSDQAFALRQLMRSYELQIDYLTLLARYEVLDLNGALREMRVIREKMDHAAERLWQLRVVEQGGQQLDYSAIDPSLIPDLQYI